MGKPFSGILVCFAELDADPMMIRTHEGMAVERVEGELPGGEVQAVDA